MNINEPVKIRIQMTAIYIREEGFLKCKEKPTTLIFPALQEPPEGSGPSFQAE